MASLPAPAMTYAFDTETTPVRITDTHWRLTLASDWNIGNNPNGGFLLACLMRAMSTQVPDTPDPLAVSTHYLRPGLSEKPADLHVSIVRQGRRTATVAGSMEQEGKPRITCTATFGHLSPSDEALTGGTGDNHRSLTIAPPDLPPPGDCISRTELAQGITLPIMNRLDIRVDPMYATAGVQKEARMSGWIKFRDDRPSDLLAIPLFCDAFPPSVFTLYGQVGWVPTIELSVYLRRQPLPGWIKGAFSTKDLAGNLFIEDAILWDENDLMVGQSRQLQMILDA